MDFTERGVLALEDIAQSLRGIRAILDVMVTEGIVTIPDVPASDN